MDDFDECKQSGSGTLKAADKSSHLIYCGTQFTGINKLYSKFINFLKSY